MLCCVQLVFFMCFVGDLVSLRLLLFGGVVVVVACLWCVFSCDCLCVICDIGALVFLVHALRALQWAEGMMSCE